MTSRLEISNNKFQILMLLAIGAIILLPKISLAKTVSYNDQSWLLNPPVVQTQNNFVRNNIDLKNLTLHVFANAPISSTAQILDSQSVSQLEQLNEKVNQPVASAQLNIKDDWATTFVPDQNGRSVDNFALISQLSSNSDDFSLPIVTSSPAVRLSDLNSLGINELVAVGESDFSGSSNNRIINVKVGSSKYDGLILQPGEEFSFNKYLGDIDAAHGFKPEQVIKASGIELEFGGGLCQVSTTMFRAAMNAGLPIVERRNHSFAVHYYSPQGTDATIYPGASDLKFTNNFDHPILIHTYVQAPHVYFEIYGTKDDRVVTFEGPVQFDKKSDGSMKATWTRHVTMGGQTTTYVAKSTYVSPLLYKKVDAASTPNPQAAATPANTPSPSPTNS